jgi:hypothetical protein
VGLLLVILGLLLWLFAGWAVIGLILIILGLFLLFAPGPFYGYSHWHHRRGPP